MVNQKSKYDDEFFINIIKENETYLYKAAYVYLGNKEEAMDALQEMAYRAYKNRKKIKDEKYIKSWLLKILLNHCRDRLKKRARVVYLKDTHMEIFATQPMEFEDRIENSIILKEALDGMKSNYKEVIILRYVNDMKVKDISELLKKSEGTIKIWLHRGLGQLRAKINEEGIKNA